MKENKEKEGFFHIQPYNKNKFHSTYGYELKHSSLWKLSFEFSNNYIVQHYYSTLLFGVTFTILTMSSVHKWLPKMPLGKFFLNL